jgi:hypothetical protein
MVTAVTSRDVKRYAVWPAACALLALTGCAGQGSAEDRPAAEAAEHFTQDVKADPAAACGLLAPQTRVKLEDEQGPCARSLPQSKVPQDAGSVREVKVYGKDAVAYLERDTVFLARFDDGWRVTAAGCTPNGDRPYDCDVEGS